LVNYLIKSEYFINDKAIIEQGTSQSIAWIHLAEGQKRVPYIDVTYYIENPRATPIETLKCYHPGCSQ